jgi:hypothetical protein
MKKKKEKKKFNWQKWFVIALIVVFIFGTALASISPLLG